MGRKQEYKETNLEFLKELSSQEGVYALPCGIYYKVLETGTGTVFPNVRSIVTVHYKGSLINGRVFDNSYERIYLTRWDMEPVHPVRFRLFRHWYLR